MIDRTVEIILLETRLIVLHWNHQMTCIDYLNSDARHEKTSKKGSHIHDAEAKRVNKNWPSLGVSSSWECCNISAVSWFYKTNTIPLWVHFICSDSCMQRHRQFKSIFYILKHVLIPFKVIMKINVQLRSCTFIFSLLIWIWTRLVSQNVYQFAPGCGTNHQIINKRKSEREKRVEAIVHG